MRPEREGDNNDKKPEAENAEESQEVLRSAPDLNTTAGLLHKLQRVPG